MATPALLLDLGNQRLKAATSSAGGVWTALEITLQDLAEVLPEHRGAWVSCTRPAALQELLDQPDLAPWLRPVDADAVPMERASRGTGSDRLLAALAAHRLRGGAALVADFGTAWTLDLVDAGGTFRGGAIGPGLGVQVQALAAACPHLDPPDPDPAPGLPTDTAAAVAAGTAWALAMAVDALARLWQEEAGAPAARLFTGGDAAALARWLPAAWQQHPNLVLEGLSWVAAGQPAVR